MSKHKRAPWAQDDVHQKYNSPYPSVVVYRSDKNFVVRLKSLIDKELSAIGYPLSYNDERFIPLIKALENSEDYLFESKNIDQ